uniref:hypothetical protein n=1 Tax=Phormidesmis priestleyi TaxID=268141 RepID=UPI001E5B736F
GLDLNALGSILEQTESIRLFRCPLIVSNRGRTRTNGPAGTSGGESNLNLRAYRANNGSFMQSAMLSDNLTSSAYSAPTQASYSNQSATLVPVECLPGGANNR